MTQTNSASGAPEEAASDFGQETPVHDASIEAVSDASVQERPVKKTLARRLTVAGVFLASCVGIVFGAGFGTLSSFGWESIAAICPLGALESMLAAKLLIPQALAFLLIVAVVAAILGKVFCAWACPVPSMRACLDAVARKVPRIRSEKVKREDGDEAVSLHVVRSSPRRDCGCGACTACSPRERRAVIDSRHVVLGGTLLSAAVFGFPVFCLVCPIGLTFASVIAVVQLFGLQILSWGVLLFPLMLVLELTVLRKWCSKFCPLGALVSLLSRPNRLFRPKVDGSRCLRDKGVDCTVCADICPEGLDPHLEEGMHDCSKCRDCADNCPAHAISFPVRR